MLEFTEPVNHDRFNAWMYDMLNIKICGSVCIPGDWDCYETLGYLERRFKKPLMATMCEDGSVFMVGPKTVYFLPDEVIIVQH